MASQGPLYPSTAVDAGGGTVAWADVNNSKVEDGAEASCAVIGPGGGGGTPNVLRLTSFGFTIPTNAPIDGIKLEIKVHDTGVGTEGDGIELGTSSITVSKPNVNWGDTLQWLTFGGSTDKWGRTWTPTEINGTDFGSNLWNMFVTGTGGIFVDSVRITVYYTEITSRLQTGKARMTAIVNRVQTGVANISATTTRTQTGVAKILRINPMPARAPKIESDFGGLSQTVEDKGRMSL